MNKPTPAPKLPLAGCPEQRKRILRVLRPFARHFKELEFAGWALSIEPVALTGTGLCHSHIRALAKLYRDLGGK